MLEEFRDMLHGRERRDDGVTGDNCARTIISLLQLDLEMPLSESLDRLIGGARIGKE